MVPSARFAQERRHLWLLIKAHPSLRKAVTSSAPPPPRIRDLCVGGGLVGWWIGGLVDTHWGVHWVTTVWSGLFHGDLHGEFWQSVWMHNPPRKTLMSRQSQTSVLVGLVTACSLTTLSCPA